MTAGAATPPPARARLALGDGSRPLVEVLSRPDVLGKVDVRLPDGERRNVPARWLDPEDDAALDLLTSGDRVVQRAAASAPRAADDLLAALAAAQPVSFARAARLLGLRSTPNGPDRYLLSIDGRRLWALCGGRVLSVHTIAPLPPAAPITDEETAARERTPRLRGEMIYMRAPTGKGTAAPRPLRAEVVPLPPPRGELTAAELHAAAHPYFQDFMGRVHLSDGIRLLFLGQGRLAARLAVFRAVPLERNRASMQVGRRAVTIRYHRKQYLDRTEYLVNYALLDEEPLPPLREGERWLEEP